MASIRNTIGSALGTVNTSAEAVVKTVNVAIIGIDMLSHWAELEKQKQKEHTKYDPKLIAREAEARVTQRIADMNMEAATYVSKSPAHAEAYTEAQRILQEFKDEA